MLSSLAVAPHRLIFQGKVQATLTGSIPFPTAELFSKPSGSAQAVTAGGRGGPGPKRELERGSVSLNRGPGPGRSESEPANAYNIEVDEERHVPEHPPASRRLEDDSEPEDATDQ
jgi:hypothetical protein